MELGTPRMPVAIDAGPTTREHAYCSVPRVRPPSAPRKSDADAPQQHSKNGHVSETNRPGHRVRQPASLQFSEHHLDQN